MIRENNSATLNILFCHRAVQAVVVALDGLLNLLHLIDPRLPGGLRHLFLLVEPGAVWFAIASTKAVPQSGELAKVVAKGWLASCFMVCKGLETYLKYRW